MNPRKFLVGAIGMAIAIVVAACGGSTSTGSETGTLTIWLMDGSAPASVIDGVNADFKSKHPNVTVKVEIQNWGEIGNQTLTVWLASLTTNHGPQWGPLMAAATLTGLPVVAFFLMLQRWLAGGLTAGAVKG